MGLEDWLANNWFDGIQTLGIFAGFSLAAYTAWKDVLGRRIGNSIAINEQHGRTWAEFHERPVLRRILDRQVDLKRDPVSMEEEMFVNRLILNLSVAYRAMRQGELTRFEGLQRDVREFLSLPIPNAVWRTAAVFQDKDFRGFVDENLR